MLKYMQCVFSLNIGIYMDQHDLTLMAASNDEQKQSMFNSIHCELALLKSQVSCSCVGNSKTYTRFSLEIQILILNKFSASLFKIKKS